MPSPLRPGEDIYIDYKELPGSYAMPTMEAARDHYSIGFNLGGDRKFFTHDRIYYAHGKTIGFALPNVYHRNMPMSDAPYKRFLIKYKKEAVQPVVDLIGENEFFSMHMEYMYFSEESLQIITPQFENMLAVYQEHGKHSQFLLKNMLQNLILTIYQKRLPSKEDSLQISSFNEQVYEALIYIERNLAGNLSLNIVATQVSLSPSHFSRLFKHSVGFSFSEYVTHTRLEYAKLLMANEKLSITEVAERCGFNNANYFSSTFKKYNHMTPKEYCRCDS
ncbi:MAG: helix-turn-helix transcriptional regulator [Lachnospiraceae bacterium]|nr:helix-turn-helix transcriptional regulator [Lachnospiraceae bacterium]